MLEQKISWKRTVLKGSKWRICRSTINPDERKILTGRTWVWVRHSVLYCNIAKLRNLFKMARLPFLPPRSIFWWLEDKYSLVELEFEFVILAVLEETSGDLLGDDLGADVVLGGETQAHLLQDQLHLRNQSVRYGTRCVRKQMRRASYLENVLF